MEGIEAKRKLVEELLRKKLNMEKGEHIASKGQEGLFIQYKLSPESTAYNCYLQAIIDDEVDISALKKAFVLLMGRHQILRTLYKDSFSENTKVVQKVSEKYTLHWDEHNVIGMTEEEIEEFIEIVGVKPFNLEEGPIISVDLFDKGEKLEKRMLLSIHHIAVDYWSMGLLLSELGQVYSNLKNGKEPNTNLNIVKGEYVDYAKEQNLLITSAEGKKMLDYWKENLSGELPYLNFPIDFTRTDKIMHDGASVEFTLDEVMTSRIKKLAGDIKTTPYNILLGVYFALIRRYTAQDDIIIGSPVAGRNNSKYKDTVGYFVNMLPIRAKINAEQSFKDFVGQLKNTVIMGIENSEIPFLTIVKELQLQRQNNRTPVFQASFTLEKATTDTKNKNFEGMINSSEMGNGDLILKYIPTPVKSSQYEFSMYLEEIDGEFKGQIHYQTRLFKKTTIERFAKHYKNLFTEVLINPEEKLCNYCFMSTEEKEQILYEWNSHKCNFPASKCLHEIIEEQAEKYSTNIAVSFDGKTLTYEELNKKANILASYLIKNGIKAESKIPILMNPSIEMIVAILGVLKAGGTYVPLNPVYPDSRIAEIIEDIKAPLILVEKSLEVRVLEASLNKICLDFDWDDITSEYTPTCFAKVSPQQTAYIIYTSGSTGKPKGVMVSHYNVVRLFQATDQWYKFGEKDVWTMFHAVSFDFSVWEIYGALLYGGKLTIVPYYITRTPQEFYKLLSAEKVTVLNQTPSAFKQLINEDEKLIEAYPLSLRYIIFGGEALDLKSLKPWFKRHGDKAPQLVNMYGITETTVHVTYRPITITDTENDTGSLIGIPIPDLQLYLLDEYKNMIPVGVCGEIYVGGAGVAKGYLNRQELTEEKFTEDFVTNREGNRLYRSGDLGRYLPNGDIEYLGRIDNQIKIRGFRIELGDIQSKILEYENVKDAIVLIDDNGKDDKKIVAYSIMNENIKLNEGDIRHYLKAKLPDYMVPSCIIQIDEIPLNANGKINRSKLPKASNEAYALEGYIAPQKDLEKKLANVWTRVLKLDKVGIEHNFFDLGGNSIMIMEVNNIIKENIDPNITVADMFQYTTVKALAQYIESKTINTDLIEEAEEESRAQMRRNVRARRV